MGNLPYQISQFTENRKSQFTENEDFWATLPNIAIYRPLCNLIKNRNLQIINCDIDQFSARPERISQFTDLLKKIAIIAIIAKIANIAIYAVPSLGHCCNA